MKVFHTIVFFHAKIFLMKLEEEKKIHFQRNDTITLQGGVRETEWKKKNVLAK